MFYLKPPLAATSCKSRRLGPPTTPGILAATIPDRSVGRRSHVAWWPRIQTRGVSGVGWRYLAVLLHQARPGQRSPWAAPVTSPTSSSIRRCVAKPIILRRKVASALLQHLPEDHRLVGHPGRSTIKVGRSQHPNPAEDHRGGRTGRSAIAHTAASIRTPGSGPPTPPPGPRPSLALGPLSSSIPQQKPPQASMSARRFSSRSDRA